MKEFRSTRRWLSTGLFPGMTTWGSRLST